MVVWLCNITTNIYNLLSWFLFGYIDTSYYIIWLGFYGCIMVHVFIQLLNVDGTSIYHKKGHPAWGPWINMDQLDPFILEVQKVLDIFWLIV